MYSSGVGYHSTSISISRDEQRALTAYKLAARTMASGFAQLVTEGSPALLAT